VAADPTSDVATAALHIDTNQPRVVFFQRERLTPIVVDPTITEDIAALTALGGDLQLLGSDHSDRIWLAATTNDNAPVRYYTYRRGSGEPAFLFAHRPELEQYTLAAMVPAVLLVHGGP
jgi:hypothetical protein